MAEQEVCEWFKRAEKDLEEADFLLKNNRPLEHVAYFIHQGVEKALKGFLLSGEWELEKTHDLVKLLAQAVDRDSDLKDFQELAENTADYYFESRYPLAYVTEFSGKDLEENLERALSLYSVLKKKTGLEEKTDEQ